MISSQLGLSAHDPKESSAHLGKSLAAILLVLSASLTGCGESGVQEVRQWMEDAKKSTKKTVSAMSPPKKFIPYEYASKKEIDPFNPSKLLVVLANQRTKPTNNLKPDTTRVKEPLESYPLDTLKMVGTLQKPGSNYGLVQVDKVIFKVKIGNHLGQNLGKVTNVTDTEVTIKEMYQDPDGEWTERDAKLELQESKK